MFWPTKKLSEVVKEIIGGGVVSEFAKQGVKSGREKLKELFESCLDKAMKGELVK